MEMVADNTGRMGLLTWSKEPGADKRTPGSRSTWWKACSVSTLMRD